MKKWILIVILLMMVGWTVFDFVIKDEKASTDSTQLTETKDTKQKTKDIQKHKKLPKEIDNTQEIGLDVGDFAPNIELSTIEGEKRNLHDLRGEPVMLNFWASWCGPCRAEMPDMEKFYKDKDMEIFSVNLTNEESSKSNAETFIKDYKLTFPIMFDEDGDVANLYNLITIPETYIIDEDGRVFYKVRGPMNYDFMVTKYEEVNQNNK